MSYLPLSRFKYNNDGTGRKSDHEIDAEYHNRLAGPSTVTTPLYPALENAAMLDTAAMNQEALSMTKYPIYFVETTHINSLHNQVQELSKQIEHLTMTKQKELPKVAINSYLKTLLKNEIVFTNDIEGVQTNPHEIGTIIGNLDQRPGKTERRLESTIRKYKDSVTGRMRQINTLEDYRAIYDELLKGEISNDKLPDGKLFRNSFAFIGSSTKVVHIPPVHEAQISTALEQLITFMNNDTYIPLEKALVTHFMFENTHPFADGNGRLGRYLLSSYLSSKLDAFTGLSISTAIHNNLNRYYKLFQEADNLENRGELTFFIEGMLKIIRNGQQDVINELNARKDQLHTTWTKLQQLMADANNDEIQVMYILLQSYLFTESQTYGIQDRNIEEVLRHKLPKTRIKRAITELEGKNLIEKIASKPLQHVLSTELLKKILSSTSL